MEDRLTAWSIFWLICASVSLIGIILGHYHHLLTLFIAVVMMIASAKDEIESQDKH